MRDVPASMEKIWRSGDFIGAQRPIARVTLQHGNMRLCPLSFAGKKTTVNADGTSSTTPATIGQEYASFVFGATAAPKELPNVKSVSWNRSTDSDAASCSIEFYNTAPLPIGSTPTRDLDVPGFYTYNRGRSAFSSRWNQEANEWTGLLLPDNILRTYEGYGFDADLAPERDPSVVLTGTWMIDTVEYTDTGTIKVECRDYGRLLLDQMSFLPVVPPDFYPLKFDSIPKESGFIEGKTYVWQVEVANGVATNPQLVTPGSTTTPSAPTGGKLTALPLSYNDSSNTPWFDVKYSTYTVKSGDWLIKIAAKYDVPGGWRTIYNDNAALIDSIARAHGKATGGNWIFPGTKLQVRTSGSTDPSVYGHRGKDAFDSAAGTFWLSVGNISKSKSYAYEWIEGKSNGATLTSVKFTPYKSGYEVFLSVHDGKQWVKHKSTDVIPYKPSDIGRNHADVAFCERILCDAGEKEYEIKLRAPIAGAQKIRLTFHNLAAMPQYDPSLPYRAAVRTVRAYGYSQAAVVKPATPAVAPPVAPKTIIAGILDDFKRKDSLSLGRANTGDQWRTRNYAGGSAGWQVKGERAQRYKGTFATGKMVFAVADLQWRQQRCTIGMRETANVAHAKWSIALRVNATKNSMIEVKVGRAGIIYVYRVINGVYTELGSHDTGLTTLLNRRVRATVVDDTISIALAEMDADDSPFTYIPEWSLKDARLVSAEFGTMVGFGTDDATRQFSYFNGYVYHRGGIFDSFGRPDGALGTAESGQQYRIIATVAGGNPSWNVLSERAGRVNGGGGQIVWAAADLGSITQNIQITGYQGTSGTSKWAIAHRMRDSKNYVYWTLDDAGLLRVHSVVNGTDTLVAEVPTGRTFTAGPVELESTLVDTDLVISANGDVLYDADDPEHFGNPSYGSFVAFGTPNNTCTFDIFSATVPGTTGGGTGSVDNPLTTLVEYSTYVPPHIEPGAGAKPGVYEDYTDIIKLLCAWAGFYWPADATQTISDGTVTAYKTPEEDPVLGREGVGRVWGDFESTGTAGVSSLTVDIFDKKSLMDGISYVRDIIGFLFYIDETGGVVWHQPNIFSVGNTIATISTNPGRTDAMVDIDEKQTLIGLRATLNSRNVRERVFVANTDGAIGATAAGWNPNPVGLRRVAGWTDQHFGSAAECLVMADLITIRQLFAYRTDSVTIMGFPKIQIDDQVRIFEQTTSEGYIHYVQGISSSNNLETGEWVYTLDTHWLGEKPFEKWAFDPAQLSQETQNYLDALAGKTGGKGWYELPRGTTLPDMAKINLVFQGSALTYGSGAPEAGDYPEQLRLKLNNAITANITKNNLALPQQDTEQMAQPDFAARVDTSLKTGWQNILLVWEGSQHLASSSSVTADQAFSALKSYCLARKAAGYRVVVMSVLPRQDAGIPSNFEVRRTDLNMALRQHWDDFADFFVDFGQSPLDPLTATGNPTSNQTYYASNKYYLTRAGYTAVCDHAYDAVIHLLAGGA